MYYKCARMRVKNHVMIVVGFDCFLGGFVTVCVILHKVSSPPSAFMDFDPGFCVRLIFPLWRSGDAQLSEMFQC